MQFWVLESPAQFSTHCIVIGSTVRLRILGLGIVIERTVCEKCCCYLQHSLPGQAAGFLQNLLLSSAQFGKIHGLFRVVIGGTFLLPGQNQGCYVRHIFKNSAGFSPVVICSTFSGWGLLFSAQFPKSAKWAPHDSCPKNNFFGLLCPAHCSFAHKTVVIYSTPQLESAAHFCCNFRHSYTLFLNIYK